MAVVNYHLFTQRQCSEVADEERSVVHRTQPEKVHDDAGSRVEGSALPFPLFEVVQSYSLLSQCGLGEAEFILFGLARDEMAHLRKTLLADGQLYFLPDSVLQIEGEQRTLRSEAFVAECKQGRLFQYTFYFFAKPKEA